MSKQEVVIFPDTVPAERMLIPLVPVFQPVVYLQTVENDPHPAELMTPDAGEMIREGMCALRVPSPLGTDRERFLRLVTDLRNRRDDYAAQLGNVSLAEMSAGGRPGQESGGSIVSSLLRRQGIVDTGRDELTAVLWQARLVLKLGEFLDADRQELERRLKDISGREEGLFAELGKEAGSPFRLTEQMQDLADRGDRGQPLRLKAWTRIFVLGEEVSAARCLVTADNDAMDQLIETYRQATGVAPVRICRVKLPARCPDRQDFRDRCHQVQKEGAGRITRLADLLAGSNGDGGVSPPELCFDGDDQWEALLELCFPSVSCGRCTLSLYRFPGISPRALFWRTFGDMDHAAPERQQAPAAGVVVGLLEV